jgi:hypothetical protein
MVMLFNLEFDVRYYGDLYVATVQKGSSPRACVMCESGGLLFYPHRLI